MGADIEFFGQLSLSRTLEDELRATKVPKSALRRLPIELRREASAVRIGRVFEQLALEAVMQRTTRTLRFAGSFDEGLFFEAWSAPLAAVMVGAARIGVSGWLLMENVDFRMRLESDGDAVAVSEPDDAALHRAQKSPAHQLLDQLDAARDPKAHAAANEAVDAFFHGTEQTPSSGTVGDGFEAAVWHLERADARAVIRALGTLRDVPSSRGLVRPIELFGSKAKLLDAVRNAKIIEHCALAIDVLPEIAPSRFGLVATQIIRNKKSAPAFKAAAARVLARSDEDSALDALLSLAFGVLKQRDRNDPVMAAMHSLAESVHPAAAQRAFDAMPALKGKRGDRVFDRAMYIIVTQAEIGLRPRLAAIAADPKHRHRYSAEGACDCLDAGHTGNFLSLAVRV